MAETDEKIYLSGERALSQGDEGGELEMEEGTREEGGDALTAFARRLLEQEEEIRAEEPDFDLRALIEQSPAFKALLLVGEPVKKALEYVQPERVGKRLEKEILERIRRRNLRPQSATAAARPAKEEGAQRFSEEEMQRIDALLKRGQKVYL